MGRYASRTDQKILFLVGCAFISAYVVYRYWKKRKFKLIDEDFEETFKAVDNPQKRVLLLGLKDAGKTLLINQIFMASDYDMVGYTVPPQPTEGSVITTLQNGSYFYNIWEIGGSDSLIPYWTMFLHDTDLIIFVVDSSNGDKLSLAATSLKCLLNDPRIAKTPILIVASKQDHPNALKPEQVKEALDLLSLSQPKHKIEVIGCQIKPSPHLLKEKSKYTWYDTSIDAIKKKIFSMTVS